uniref:Uncharacterized protein n=1 Tax=Alexandrium catenella TaxID=2925 RepID=A0A7S1W5F6_ALECA
MPNNVQRVSLEPLGEGRVMVRLAHRFGLGEDAELSRPATVDLAEVFAGWRLVGAEERGLAGTIPRDEVLQRRVAWSIEGEGASAVRRRVEGGSPTEVTLGPLQIRTFHLEVASPEVYL